MCIRDSHQVPREPLLAGREQSPVRRAGRQTRQQRQPSCTSRGGRHSGDQTGADGTEQQLLLPCELTDGITLTPPEGA